MLTCMCLLDHKHVVLHGSAHVCMIVVDSDSEQRRGVKASVDDVQDFKVGGGGTTAKYGGVVAGHRNKKTQAGDVPGSPRCGSMMSLHLMYVLLTNSVLLSSVLTMIGPLPAAMWGSVSGGRMGDFAPEPHQTAWFPPGLSLRVRRFVERQTGEIRGPLRSHSWLKPEQVTRHSATIRAGTKHGRIQQRASA